MQLFQAKPISVKLSGDNQRIEVACANVPEFDVFREAFLKALDYRKTHSIKHWLLDFRKIDELREDEETWLQVQFFPQLMMLGEENYFAMVVSEECYDRMLRESGTNGLRSYNSFIIINTFNNLEEAENWLREPHISH